MSHTSAVAAPATHGPAVPAVPLARIAPWALFFFVLASVSVFFVTAAQGAAHEWVHDARHLLGYPCH